MNKTELVDAMAQSAGISKVQAKKALDAFIEASTVALKSGDAVSLVGFGSLKTKIRPARQGRNPRTRQPLMIPERRVVVFKPGKELEEAVK